jgi:hypothetical protein
MRRVFILLAAAAVLPSGPASAAGHGAQTRIVQAFEKLGMAPQRSDCYGRIISSRLRLALSRKAAEILESSENGDDVRDKVESVGGRVQGAFMSAKANCGL